MRLWHRIEGFFFQPVSARGFGLLRVLWSATTLSYLLMQFKDVTKFYSDEGLLPTDLLALIIRVPYRFSLLDWITDPTAVFALYLLLCLALFLVLLGLWSRVSLLVSIVLLFSFHERNPLILGGGDTVLRLVGFILLLAPNISALSLARLRAQWAHWKNKRTLLPEPMQPIWPYRLLLWQFIVLYTTSVWVKLTGTMWVEGTAVGAALRHPHFSRLIAWNEPFVQLFAKPITWSTLVFEAAWITMLIPTSLTKTLFRWQPQQRLKQLLIVLGIGFHSGIQATMIVGSFSLAMLSSYAGLLLGKDFEDLRSLINRRTKSRSQHGIIILFDGNCGLCLRSVFGLTILDWLHRLHFVDFWDKDAKHAIAPDLKMEDLDKAMHVLLPNFKIQTSNFKVEKGFDGIRALAWHLPPLWLVAPFLYLPGIAHLGRRVYGRVAKRRKRCEHENCGL